MPHAAVRPLHHDACASAEARPASSSHGVLQLVAVSPCTEVLEGHREATLLQFLRDTPHFLGLLWEVAPQGVGRPGKHRWRELAPEGLVPMREDRHEGMLCCVRFQNPPHRTMVPIERRKREVHLKSRRWRRGRDQPHNACRQRL